MAAFKRTKVEEHLTCSVCSGPFKDPKVLPCLHSYCHGCIVTLTKNAKSNTINCPGCGLAVKVDDNTISNLPSNFFVNNLLATKVLCDSCDSQDTAESRCNECGIYLCQFCVEFHKRSRLLRHHELLTMEQLKSKKIAEKIRCSKHKDEIIELFCKTCQTTGCRDCIIFDHRHHEYGFVEEVAMGEKEHLQQSLDNVKQRKGRVVQGIVNLKIFYNTLETNKNSTTTEINHHFDELGKSVAESLECRRNEMIAKATSLTNSKQTKIRAQLQVLKVALASCENSIEFTERALNNGNDIQIASMSKHILQSLVRLKDVEDQTNPSVTEDMMFVIPSSVEETKEKLFNEYDVNGAVTNLKRCDASFGVGLQEMEIGQQYFITLVCRDTNNQRLSYGGQHIKPSFSGLYVSDVAVADNNDGSYTISFRPRQGGMLKFEVSINGIPAPNCLLTKRVKWVMSDAHGKGVVTDGGLTMKGEGRESEYCWRVGGCYFESGVHTWKVRFHLNERRDSYGASYLEIEVGIIDCSEIDQRGTKWVYEHKSYSGSRDGVSCSLVLDMEKRTLNITGLTGYSFTKTYQFTAQRVSPFFACKSPYVSIGLLK